MAETLSGKPAPNKHITVRFIEHEAVLMNLENLKTYSLNETASIIWSLVERSMTVDEIVHEITEQYDVPQNECADEVTRLLENWKAENLIHITGNNA